MTTFFRIYRRVGYATLAMSFVTGLMACSDLSNPSIPEGTQSPTTYYTRQGGLELTKAAMSQFRTGIVQMIVHSGLLTDEFTNHPRTETNYRWIDPRERSGAFGNTQPYQMFHKVRGQAHLARGILRVYAPDISPGILGQLYAIEGYSVLMLADVYCSGVPLSTLDFDGDFTYKPSSTTDQLYTHAIALFDSALTLSSDSASIRTLAQIGKGRALLRLGRYNEAKDAVVDVSDTDLYRLRISFLDGPVIHVFGRAATVADNEGLNGLPFKSSGDPRTATQSVQYVYASVNERLDFPQKYSFNDSTWLNLANSVEAHLIRAEAALHEGTGNQWLMILSALRTDGTYSKIDTLPGDIIDTVWNAGIGGVARLGPLSDPGTLEARIKLLFDERAKWLFATGHRQGDLRRLVRKYGWDSEMVYPTGNYNSGVSETGYYGVYTSFPIPEQEGRNPYFRGCLND
jgi:hypothetical protein